MWHDIPLLGFVWTWEPPYVRAHQSSHCHPYWCGRPGSTSCEDVASCNKTRTMILNVFLLRLASPFTLPHPFTMPHPLPCHTLLPCHTQTPYPIFISHTGHHNICWDNHLNNVPAIAGSGSGSRPNSSAEIMCLPHHHSPHYLHIHPPTQSPQI